MKKIISLLFLFLIQISVGQKKIIKIFNQSTNLPIENVNLNYSNLNEGTFTNADGVASLDLKKNDLKISMLGYEEKNLTYDELGKTDTIFLNPITIQLQEVVIKSFNLKQAIKYVLENFAELYVDIPFEKECEFKESVHIDDNLKRLIVSKVNWWDKSYQRKKAIKLRLATIEHNKAVPLGIFTDVPNRDINSGILPKSLKGIVDQFYLDHVLKLLLDDINKMETQVIETTENTIKIDFTTKKAKEIKSGSIIFDKNSKAVLNVLFNHKLNDWSYKLSVKENSKKLLLENPETIVSMDFYKSLDNKLSLKSEKTTISLSITYNEVKHNAKKTVDIYVLNETAKNSVSNEGLIDIKKVF